MGAGFPSRLSMSGICMSIIACHLAFVPLVLCLASLSPFACAFVLNGGISLARDSSPVRIPVLVRFADLLGGV